MLYTLFIGQPLKIDKERFYDFITYYFYLWVHKKKELPNQATLYGIYGEFLWGSELSNLLSDEFFDTKPSEYGQELRRFRKLALTKIVEYVDPTYPKDYENDFITLDDISYFIQMVAKTKIWKDNEIKENEVLIREFVNSISRSNYKKEIKDEDKFYISHKGDYEEIDFFNKELPLTKAYEYLEKDNWKKYTLEEFHPYIDAIDLTKFKQLLKDPLQRHFLPQGRQSEFLLRHKRFNWIGASRRS